MTTMRKGATMAKVELLAPFIRKWEGGFANDPADAGGATNMGVTISTFELYCHKKGYPKPTVERLKNLSVTQWTDILKTLFWDKWQADMIQSQRIANILVDWYWGSGKWGIIIPQRILDVPDDGIVGQKTINAVNFAEPDDFFDAIYNARVKYLNDIVQRSIAAYEAKIHRTATQKELMTYTNKRFLSGWMRRLNDIKNL